MAQPRYSIVPIDDVVILMVRALRVHPGDLRLWKEKVARSGFFVGAVIAPTIPVFFDASVERGTVMVTANREEAARWHRLEWRRYLLMVLSRRLKCEVPDGFYEQRSYRG